MHILLRALALEGRRAAQSQSYEPTSRGGFCYSDLVVCDDGADYPLATKLDMIAALSQVGLDRSLALIKPGALVIVDERLVPDPPRRGFDLHVLPISQRAVADRQLRASPTSSRSARWRACRACAAPTRWSRRCGWRRRRNSPPSISPRYAKVSL